MQTKCYFTVQHNYIKQIMVGNLYTLAPIKAVVLLDALINRKRSSCVTEKSVNDILTKLKIKLH